MTIGSLHLVGGNSFKEGNYGWEEQEYDRKEPYKRHILLLSLCSVLPTIPILLTVLSSLLALMELRAKRILSIKKKTKNIVRVDLLTMLLPVTLLLHLRLFLSISIIKRFLFSIH